MEAITVITHLQVTIPHFSCLSNITFAGFLVLFFFFLANSNVKIYNIKSGSWYKEVYFTYILVDWMRWRKHKKVSRGLQLKSVYFMLTLYQKDDVI